MYIFKSQCSGHMITKQPGRIAPKTYPHLCRVSQARLPCKTRRRLLNLLHPSLQPSEIATGQSSRHPRRGDDADNETVILEKPCPFQTKQVETSLRRPVRKDIEVRCLGPTCRGRLVDWGVRRIYVYAARSGV